MLGHYFAVALLNFRKAPFATVANVAVLALGFTAFLAAYAVIGFWGRAERYFPNADRTYVISSRIEQAGSVVLREIAATNSYAASYLLADYPQIEAAARAARLGSDVPVAGDDRSIRLNAVAVDPDFLNIFDLPFLVGDARAALRAPRSVVLTRETAERLFGTDDPLGRDVQLGNAIDATVTGVVDAIPEPSHLGRSASASMTFDMLTSMDLLDRYRGNRGGGPPNWFGIDGPTYLLLPADESITARKLARELDGFLARHMPADQASFASLQLGLVPLPRMLTLDADGAFLGGDRSITALLWMLGGLVLAVACVNYASLAAARASRRVHEVGVRKAIGAGAGDVLRQHLLEAGLMTTVALSLALVAVHTIAPAVRASSGIDLDLALAFEPGSLAFFAALAVTVTLLAGAYPAFVLARVRPIFALRAPRLRPGRKLLMSLLVGMQFAAASVLLITTIVVYLQNQELRRMELALAADPLVVIENHSDFDTLVDPDTLHDELLRLPRVRAVTETARVYLPSQTLPLARSADAQALQRPVNEYETSYDYANVVDQAILAGRVFERGRDQPGRRRIVVNRAFVDAFGLGSPEAAVGTTVYVPKSYMTSIGVGDAAQPREIIGVLEDKFFDPLDVGPAMYRLSETRIFTLVKIQRDEVAGALDNIDALWKRLAPGIAVQRRFADEIFDEAHEGSTRIAYVFTALGSFAMLIAVVGLFAMAQVVAARRVREIGVRKVLGAATAEIVVMLLRSFSLPVVVASVVAWPIAFIVVRHYLDRYVSPVQLDAVPFVAGSALVVAIAWLAVGAQTLRAARTAPANVLRHE